mgnify:CR=1 FL=1
MTFLAITDAIEWTAARWGGQRAAPIRLHQARSVDGALGGLMFTHSFASALDSSPSATTDAVRTVPCYHPLAGNRPARDCPECFGLGVKDVRVSHYRYPMTLALAQLANTLRPRRQPHPLALVLALADHGWDWRATSRSLDVHPDMGEALLLRALRQLHSRYAEGPVRISWIAKSESQQHAEALAS